MISHDLFRWKVQGSNLWPSACRADALPAELTFLLSKKAGNLLLSRAVPSQVPSAAWAFTVVFGMGTGVSLKRIITSQLPE